MALLSLPHRPIVCSRRRQFYRSFNVQNVKSPRGPVRAFQGSAASATISGQVRVAGEPSGWSVARPAGSPDGPVEFDSATGSYEGEISRVSSAPIVCAILIEFSVTKGA